MGGHEIHIANGGSLAHSLRETGAATETLHWQEGLYCGPLALTDDASFTALRKEYWEDAAPFGMTIWVHAKPEATRSVACISDLVPELQAAPGITLWFEHDLFDQSMLWYVLRQLEPHGSTLPPIRLVSIDRFGGIDRFRGMGQLMPEQLMTLLPEAAEITAEHMRCGALGWQAFAGGDTGAQDAFAASGHPLPFAGRAMRAWIKQRPHPRSGLGDIHESLVRVLRDSGEMPCLALVTRAFETYDADFGLSDLAAATYLAELAEDPRNLLAFGGDGFPRSRESMETTTVRLTDAGLALIR